MDFQLPDLTISSVASSGRDRILKSQTPSRERNQGERDRSKVRAEALSGKGKSVARGGSLFRLGRVGSSQVFCPERKRRGRGEFIVDIL
jgi:hypothetical protein